MDDEDLDTISRRADSLIEDHAELLSSLIAQRKKHRISQSVVAERMGVSQPTVAGIERYDANPTLSTIRRYALAVGARLRTTVIDDCSICEDNRAFRAVVSGPPFTRPESGTAAPSVESWSTTRVSVSG